MESNDFRSGKGRPPLATCLRIKKFEKILLLCGLHSREHSSEKFDFEDIDRYS